MTSSSFAMESKSTDSKESKLLLLPPVTYCETANATDSEGNIIFSVSCCKTFKTQPSPETVINTKISLTLCAEDKLDKIMSIE